MAAAPESLQLLGSRVDRVDLYEAMARVGLLMDTPGVSQVVTLNPEYVMMARREPKLQSIINCSALSVPDGMGIVWASRLLREPLRARVTGTGLLPEICRLSARKGLSVYLLGGRPGVAGQAARELMSRFPDLTIAGTSDHDPDPKTDDQTVAEINRSGAQVLAVAYGCPKQDYWIDRNRDSLTTVRLAIGVGGALDFISGEVPRAPRWVRRAGMEWLYRLWLQPARLGRMLALPRFGWNVIRERRKQASFPES